MRSLSFWLSTVKRHEGVDFEISISNLAHVLNRSTIHTVFASDSGILRFQDVTVEHF